MTNPSGAAGGNSQNIPTAQVPRTFSTFPLEYHFMDTHRFGEYHPHYVEEGVKQDRLPIRSSHNVMSYTLKSPLLQNITLKKDYFNVPKEAILPLNWEKFFDNPARGDDVSNDVGTAVENFWNKVGVAMNAMTTQINTYLSASGTTEVQALMAAIRYITIGEMFYSNGNLLASLGCHGAPYINLVSTIRANYSSQPFSFDKFYDFICGDIEQELAGSYFTAVVDGYTYNVCATGEEKDYPIAIPLRHFLCLVRDNLMFEITSISQSTQFKTTLKNEFAGWTITAKLANVPCNLERLFAYQLCCAHYYSNDHIDFVYSADLYRQLIGHYVKTVYGSSGYVTGMFFTRNGISYQYDYLSAHVADKMIDYWKNNPSATLNTTNMSGQVANMLGYLSAVFSYRRSLRYLDYFTGSRAQPLAVGSTGVNVVSNTVDVVDVTRNIQKQRFLNAVNRVRHNFEGYLQGIFGGDVPAPDYHNPFFLASTSDVIYGQETENTGAAQLSNDIAITTNLRSNGSRYMLEINCDRPSVIIGITHYDLPRVYSRSMERMFLHVDRFDMFNPFMQYIGDQPLYVQELGIDVAGNWLNTMSNFGYSLRHMEYKQRFNQAAGGFVENLPGWCFIANDQRGSQNTINPDWIRAVQTELDRFYVSLTGYSLGSYWHFIVDNYNDCSGQRPMAYAPSIL